MSLSCLDFGCLGGEPAVLPCVGSTDRLNAEPCVLLGCAELCRSLAMWETGPPVGVAEEGDGPGCCLWLHESCDEKRGCE